MAANDPTATHSAILLATDLSSRCDRAFDRACALAESRRATLHIVTAIDGDVHQPSWRSEEHRVIEKMRAEVADALGGRDLSWELVVAPGRPHEVVIEAATRIGVQLIVTGAARNELLGRHSPGRTVEALIRKAPAPVLVVRQRPRQEYQRILVPTDFSQVVELAVLRAAAMFPEAQFTLLHGYRVPFGSFLSEEAHQDEIRTLAVREQSDVIARLETQIGRGRLVGLVEYGGPDLLVADYDDKKAPDLMLLGAHEHSGILGALSVDVAGRLLMAAGCDVLVVPEASELVRSSGAPALS